MTGLYAVPPFGLLAAALVVTVGTACGGQLLVQRAFRRAEFVAQNDVAGFIIAVVGTLYAVVLGFVTVIVWQQYDATRERVALETASVADAWHTAVGLAAPVRSAVRRDMLAYAQTMVRDEWPLMRSGQFSRRGDALIMDATTAVGTMVPHNAAQNNAQAVTLQLLDELHDARQQRLAGNLPAVSDFQWVILLIGALVVVGFCYLFGVEHRRAHLLMTGAVAVLVTSMFVLLFELQYPFRSDLGIQPTPWTGTIQHIEDMDARGPARMRM